MFTGIVEAKVKILSHSVRDEVTTFVIQIPSGWEVAVGQSIAVNGVCLTVVTFDDDSFTVELMQETLDKTTYGKGVPTVVNLERAMAATGRFEGHIMQGHVDTVGVVSAITKGEETMVITVSHASEFDTLLVEKGSIAIDGVSLTVVNCNTKEFSVWIIPHTISKTILGDVQVADFVNLEFDIIGKYIGKRNNA
jgi:riboflavin synthase